MRTTRILLISGLILFFVGVWAAFRLFAGHTDTQWIVLTALGLSVFSSGLAAWRLHTRVDFDRVAAEQRLWESGPLGRTWLRIRKGLFWND